MPKKLARSPSPSKPLSALPHMTHILGYNIKKFERSTRKVMCPSCGFVFDLLYARTVACQGCPEAVLGCELVRCPKCDLEFQIAGSPIAATKRQSRSVRNYVTRTMDDYFKSVGESPKQ